MRASIFIIPLLLIASCVAFAQTDQEPGPEQGGHEVELWTGGGHSVAGGRGDTGAFNAGLRYGWILTGPHLPGLLRGRFEYAVDAVPVFFVFQPAGTAYGAGFDPLGLKWNFERHGRFSPYLELTGGVLFTNQNVPADTNTVNFMDQAALGTHILGAKYNWSLELRYMHISNAGLGNLNPGVNTVQVRLGVGRFFRGSKPLGSSSRRFRGCEFPIPEPSAAFRYEPPTPAPANSEQDRYRGNVRPQPF